MSNIKSIIQIIRHGVRTSSLIGRKEDSVLNESRKGLTCVGCFQFFQYGRLYLTDEFFKYCLNNGKVNVIASNKSRVLDSSYALINGIYSKNDYENKIQPTNFIEKTAGENTLNSPKFDPLNKYNFILNNFSQYKKIKTTNDNEKAKVNFLISKSIFDKSISSEDNFKILTKFSQFEQANSKEYIDALTPYFKKLFLKDLEKGVFDFSTDNFLDKDYFSNKGSITLTSIKNIADFIRCNKFHEDIPIYRKEYKDFLKILERFLINFYENSSTIEEEINILRLKSFFLELFKIVESESPSYNIFINHNTAIRTFIKFMLSGEEYMKISTNKEVSDKDFFIVCPRFGGRYSIKIRSDKNLVLEADGENITGRVRKEFISKKEGEEVIDYYKFRAFLSDVYCF